MNTAKTTEIVDTYRPVTGIPFAEPNDTLKHFEQQLSFETDCWSVHAAIEAKQNDFVLLDVRTPELYVSGHIKTAINLPYRRINERNLAQFAEETLFVVYCSGPHCSAADRAAANLAQLDRRVKKMVGGIIGWKHDGFDLQTSADV
jgi:rhodanese-related sulfurtransferase